MAHKGSPKTFIHYTFKIGDMVTGDGDVTIHGTIRTSSDVLAAKATVRDIVTKNVVTKGKGILPGITPDDVSAVITFWRDLED